ncbi:MAG TPA: ABC transporter permease [Chthonomonadaceae bacterium]|nr:ABC transporter permease [Chthonomonadaceae bacterium]
MQADSQADLTPQTKSNHPFLSAISGILAPLTFLILLCIALSLLVPNFNTRDNYKVIAIQAAVVAILACGQTAVIISGNIDLSVGAVMALAGVSSALMMSQHHYGVWGGVLVACLTGLAAGLINGLITALGKIPSFIVTLGMMGVAYGLGGILSGSQYVSNLAPGYEVFGTGELFGTAKTDGIPYAVLIMAVVAIAVGLTLARTRWGRGLYAIGGNREAARLSGISLTGATISVFALSGFLAGLASVIEVSRTNTADYSAGTSYELFAVAATVIGGTSLFGGQGGIPGTILGALLMFTIRNGCTLKNIEAPWQRLIIGVIVILAVLYDRFSSARKRARV